MDPCHFRNNEIMMKILWHHIFYMPVSHILEGERILWPSLPNCQNSVWFLQTFALKNDSDYRGFFVNHYYFEHICNYTRNLNYYNFLQFTMGVLQFTTAFWVLQFTTASFYILRQLWHRLFFTFYDRFITIYDSYYSLRQVYYNLR